jgi:hypothetical protein
MGKSSAMKANLCNCKLKQTLCSAGSEQIFNLYENYRERFQSGILSDCVLHVERLLIANK